MRAERLHQVVFRAHRSQLELLSSRARLVGFVGGAGSGKTTAGVVWSLMKAATLPGSRGMLIARSYPQLRQSLMVELEKWARASRLDEVWQFHRADMEIRLPNAARFWLRSADRPESLLGADLAWLYGDEVALWDEAAFKYALSRLRQPGFRQQAVFTFTPKGRNWAYNVFGLPRADDQIHIIRASTRDNPYLDPAFIAMLEAQYGTDTLWARQEIEGEFVSFEGLVYPQFSETVHVRPAPDHAAFSRIVAGVDWGFTNPGAIIVVGQYAPGHPAANPSHHDAPPDLTGPAAFAALKPTTPHPTPFHVLDEAYGRNIPPDGPRECWVSIAARLAVRWGIEVFFCDPSEPGNIEAFRRAGLRTLPADNSVEPGIARVSALLDARQLFIAPSCRNLIEELSRYSFETDREGHPTGRVLKAFDHACDALRYALVGLRSRPSPRTFIQTA